MRQVTCGQIPRPRVLDEPELHDVIRMRLVAEVLFAALFRLFTGIEDAFAPQVLDADPLDTLAVRCPGDGSAAPLLIDSTGEGSIHGNAVSVHARDYPLKAQVEGFPLLGARRIRSPRRDPVHSDKADPVRIADAPQYNQITRLQAPRGINGKTARSHRDIAVRYLV